LSPVLFIILLADIDEWTSYAIVTGFADDNSATVCDDSEEGVKEKLETDAQNILTFMTSNKLIANDSKTTLMIFGRANKQNSSPSTIKVGNATITEQSEQRLLGVTISSDLKWATHTQQIKEKLHYRLYIMRHLRGFLTREALNIAAEGLFTSHLRYCISLYASIRTSHQDPFRTDLKKLQTMQNHMVRSIYNIKLSNRINMDRLRHDLGILSLNQTACIASIAEFRKSLKFDTIPQVSASLSSNKLVGRKKTRQETRGLIRLPRCSTSINQNGYLHTTGTIWNRLPADIRDLEISQKTFKNRLRKWIHDSDIP